MSKFNINIKVILTSIFFLFNLSQLLSQDFYFNQSSEVVSLNYGISPQWVNLNVSESHDFLNNAGFVDIKSYTNYGKEIVSGTIHSNNFIYIRRLIFENKIITAYSDAINFIQPCLLCFAKDVKTRLKNNPDMQEIINKNYQTAIVEDNKLKDLFYKYHKQSLTMDGINTELQGDITDFGFKYINSIENENFNIIRNCSLTLDEKNIYNFYSERRFEIKEQNYFVENYNLKEVNQYDLNLMIDIFLLDCKSNNILVKKSKITASFESLEGETLGLSYGFNNDNIIVLRIDPLKWKSSSTPKRWYLIYHELGHDVLNLNHGNGGKMMFNFADRGYSWKEFLEDKSYMFNSYKRLKK